MPNDPAMLQRLACYLDCEGTIMVRQGPRALYRRISITNTYVPLMSWLVDTVGGTVHPHAVRIKGAIRTRAAGGVTTGVFSVPGTVFCFSRRCSRS
jgi:hypothetical protein